MVQIIINRNGQSTYASGASWSIGDLDLEFLNFPKTVSGEFRFISRLEPFEGEIIHMPDFTVTADSPRVSLPREKLTAGIFKSRLVYYEGGRERRRYPVEDLVITDLDNDFVAQPRLDKLEADIGALKSMLEQEQAAREKTEKHFKSESDKKFEEIEKHIQTLTDFAKDCITAIPYLYDYEFKEENKYNEQD